DTESGWPTAEDSATGELHVVPSYLAAWPDSSTAMQKLADGQDTDAVSSLPPPPRCAAAPQAGTVPAWVAPAPVVAEWGGAGGGGRRPGAPGGRADQQHVHAAERQPSRHLAYPPCLH